MKGGGGGRGQALLLSAMERMMRRRRGVGWKRGFDFESGLNKAFVVLVPF